MKSFPRFCLLLIVSAIAFSSSFAQETFKNPAMEQESEFDRAFARAHALAREGNIEEAIREFRKAAGLKNGQCPECFRFIGQVYFQAAKYKEAAAAFRQALALKTDKEADTNNALGVALYQQNDKKLYEEAVAAFRRAIELSGNRLPRVHYNLGYALIKMGSEEEGVAELKKYLEIAPSAMDASQVRAVIANPKLAFETLPVEFRVKSIAGDELSLEKFKGKVVLLDFWATWCGPCMRDMPEVKRIWKKYSADQFIILGINMDTNERAMRAYLEKEGIEWPQYFDGLGWNNKVASLYDVHSIPHTILIDHEGIVRAVGLRGGSLSGKVGDLLKKIPKASANK